jgi:hypothetical protein
MAKKLVIGHCRACGTLASLSREHVPPKATPNKNTHIALTFERAIGVGPEDIPTGPKRQGGIVYSTLCGRCNNAFGRLYVPALNEWYWAGQYLLHKAEGMGLETVTFEARDVYPLRIIKAIVTMFMAINPERFRSEPAGAGLAQLLADPQAKGLPEGVRFSTYFNHTGQLRYIPLSEVKYNVSEKTTLEDLLLGPRLRASEITYPPYGFLMALTTEGLDPRLCDISFFADFGYDEQAAVELTLAVLPTNIGVLFNDYRTLEEVKRDELRNNRGGDPAGHGSRNDLGKRAPS